MSAAPVCSRRRAHSWYLLWGKRLLDLSLSLPSAFVWLPLAAVIGLVARIVMGRPVLFCQDRPGLGGVPFAIMKFRTMRETTDDQGRLLPDAQRISRFGAFLRGTSLDELPELLNVIKGDMSLVGPRPLLARYYEWFTPAERARFLVKPGITGLAQVSGRNDLSWDQRIAADVRYSEECSLFLDLGILATTAVRVVTRRGLRVDPGATMLDFDEERRRRGVGAPK